MKIRLKVSLFYLWLLALFFFFPKCQISQLELAPNPVSDKSAKSTQEDVKENSMKDLYWGDLHMHTKLSIDAYIGGTLTSADEAYRFAKGAAIDMFGQKIKIRRPLDFCAVTDHAEALGEMFTVQNPDAQGYKSISAKFIRSIHKSSREKGGNSKIQDAVIDRIIKELDGDLKHPPFFRGYETTKSAWEIELKAAEDHYRPGKFTTFAAYEWTMGGAVTHLHRNIIFRDMIVPEYPMSAIELTDEEQLWEYLQEITNEGATVMAIPHNSNFSNGGIFTETKPDGSPYDASYAKLRAEFEPVAEIHQAKGNSEVHMSFWKNDEFADFENYAAHELRKDNYLRYALEKGLEHEEHLGINPFKYGLIGSTDTHNGTPGNTEEDDTFIGNHAMLDKNAENRRNEDWPLEKEKKVYEAVNPGGLVAVWAEANTRGYIFDALKRKETYATSGNRIQLRFFGGYGFKETYKSHDKMLKDGYEKGIPMGSDLRVNEEEIPEFLIWASKDDEGANLDRIQIIKGWYQNDSLKEEIYNVALSDGRTLNEDGSVPSNGATVNLQTGAWSKDKGDEELFVIWKDEDFNPELRCFYYVRVLELPTASWRLWDQINYNVKYPDNAELIVRERAWSSPIWYSPPN